uniref:Uncharacterized protein n=1 Tax=Aotus nancymaae TaxID=37293 RepID=A0A2K5CZL2_AOTNA
MTSDSFSKLHRKFGSVRSRQSPRGLETSWSPSSPRGPTTCKPSTWVQVRSSIWELTAATLASHSGQDPGATLLYCYNMVPQPLPCPSTCLSCTLLSTAGQYLSVSCPPSSYVCLCLDSAGRSFQPLAGYLTLSVMQSEAPVV